MLSHCIMLQPLIKCLVPMQETRCFDALAELYSNLSEDDILYGLWKRRCIHEATRAGLSLVQHGYLEQAQDVFLDSMKIDTKAPAPNGWAHAAVLMLCCV